MVVVVAEDVVDEVELGGRPWADGRVLGWEGLEVNVEFRNSGGGNYGGVRGEV